MAKKKINDYVFEPGIGFNSNLYPKAYALLVANRSFLQAQVVAFINYNIANNIGVYNGYTYSSTKCGRDVGFFIDAVAHDLRYGGNVKSRQVADYFWVNDEPQIRGNPQPEIQGQQYLRDLINNYIFTNTAVTPTYGQTAVAQTFIAGQDAESGASARNTALWFIFGDVIANGVYNIPAKQPGVTSIRIVGNYNEDDFLLITDTSTGTILYNFADPVNTISIEKKTGYSSSNNEPLSDLDFPFWWQKSDCITTINLSADTSSLSAAAEIQIFVEDGAMEIRPWNFGTDAIERMRVAMPQAMLDADFEYGLQPTKWQAITTQRSYPSLYEVPGTDYIVTAIVTDASTKTFNFGSSKITVTTQGAHGLSVGSGISIRGLNPAIRGFGRAEGYFLVDSVPTASSFIYYASAKVGASAGQSLFTSYVQLREAKFYTGAAIGSPTFAVTSNGSSGILTTKFATPSGSTSITFTGTAPADDSPIAGDAGLIAGTAVSGTVGSGTVSTTIKTTTSAAGVAIEITDTTGIQSGMALDNGSNQAIFITNISENTLNLSGPFGRVLEGADNTYTNVSTSNESSTGVGASFNVSRSAGVYTVTNSEDSTVNGQNYQIGDRLLITGDNLGGATPANDLTIFVNEVDSGGAIIDITGTGTSISGGATYSNVTQTSSTGSGINAAINVTRVGGTGQYQVTLAAGGSGHQGGDTITFSGELFDGVSPDNDITISVQGVAFGTESIVDWVFSSGLGVTGDASYPGEAGSLIAPAGNGAIFSVTALDGNYTGADATTSGTGYVVGDKLVLSGSDMNGESPLNDLRVRVTEVSSGGVVAVTVLDGTPYAGITISVFSTLTLSDPTIAEIADSVVLNTGAIAEITTTFANNHGLVPGNSILVNITSTPSPTIAATAGTIASANWATAAYGNFGNLSDGRFVAISTGSTAAAYSDDGGETWTSTTITSSAYSKVEYGVIDPEGASGLFVAVSTTSNIARISTDGITWTANNPGTGVFPDIAFNKDDAVWIACRRSSTTPRRFNGSTWSNTATVTSAAWEAIATGKIGTVNYWVMIVRGATNAAYSTDAGTSWTGVTTLPSTSNWESIAFGRERFVCVASNATSTFNCAYSTDGGATWTGVALPGAASAWQSIIYTGEVFVITGSGTDRILTSVTGEEGTWVESQFDSSQDWLAIAAATVYEDDPEPATRLVAIESGASSTVTNLLDLSYANHDLASGPVVIKSVPSLTTIKFSARSTGIIDAVSTMTGEVYARTDAFFTHRPFDGGVQLGCGSPSHGAQAIRQSKKYIRYQSGKGIMYTTGALFASSYNISSATATGTEVNSLITFTVDEGDHGVQVGAGIEIVGMNSFEYNGDYIVDSIVNSRSFRVRNSIVLTTTTATLGPDSKMVVKTWHGSTVRTGPFDDQNGLFFQYDGQQMAVVKRSSTQQIAGSVAINADSNLVTGTDTRFVDQLKVGDKIVIRGMTHIVTSIASQTSMTVNPDFRGVNNVTGVKVCLIQDIVIPQSQWNLDKLDGTGESGYTLLPWRMQMIGIQYSWYAAGFIEFMLRGADGRFIFFHKIRNSNINYEAYMRTANLPVRYEVDNASAHSKLREAIDTNSTSVVLANAHYFPPSGTVYVNNELITYGNKTGNTLSDLTRSANFTNFNGGQNRSYSAGPAASHSIGSGAILISNTITPVISHWGSALLTDGMFDEDRGYLFSYASTNISITTTRQTAFLIRLAPSVSNAIIGDLGERDLLNRAQLLLQEISITVNDQVTADWAGVVVEGVLNPQNYPSDPDNISWQAISGVSNGGQPSFAQIASGGSVDWNSGASVTERTVTTVAGRTSTGNRLYFPQATFESSGVVRGTEIKPGAVGGATFAAGTSVTFVRLGNYSSDAGLEYEVFLNRSYSGTVATGTAIPFLFGQPPFALPGETIFSFVGNPADRSTLDLAQLKELTTTAIGGRGAFPDGPDVLAINVYKVAGGAVNGNILLRWSEAQA